MLAHPLVIALTLLSPALAPQATTNPGFTAAADYSTKHAGHAVLIMQHGEILFERYDNGWLADRPHPLASGTKSFTGVMAMMAVQDGLLTLDEKAADTITEWQADPVRSQITIRHLLTLASGISPGEGALGQPPTRSRLRPIADKPAGRHADKPPKPDSFLKAALTVPMSGTPGQQFEYGPAHFYVFAEVLQRTLAKRNGPDKTVMDYLQHRVFDAIGLDNARIGRDREGNPNLPGGGMLTARDWAKFGQFVLQDGAVKSASGKRTQLLKPELLAECFKPSANNPAYGLTWWLLTDEAAADVADGNITNALRNRAFRTQTSPPKGPDGQPLKVYMAAGLGKQRLYIIPQYDMVVVRFAPLLDEGRAFDNAQFLAPILGLK